MEINKIYNESNLETIKKMPDLFCDYVLTSPPYNFDLTSCVGGDKYFGGDDSKNMNQYFAEQKELINGLLRVTKKHIFYNIQMLSGNKAALHKLIGEFSEKIKEVIIWTKNGAPAMNPGVFNSSFEYIIIFSNDNPDKRTFYDANFKRGTQSNLFKILNSHSNKFSDVHKAVMPLDIPRYFMQNFGKENDIWYDPYSGTATTSIAAIMEKRKYIGSEISKQYYNLGNNRINDVSSQISMF